LDESANIDYNRKYAIRLLSGPRPEKWKSEPRHGRGVSYSQEVMALLTAVWEAAGHPWSEHLLAVCVDAMDSQTLSGTAGDRKAAFADERPANGPAAEGPEDATASAALRADQARVFAETPHAGAGTWPRWGSLKWIWCHIRGSSPLFTN